MPLSAHAYEHLFALLGPLQDKMLDFDDFQPAWQSHYDYPPTDSLLFSPLSVPPPTPTTLTLVSATVTSTRRKLDGPLASPSGGVIKELPWVEEDERFEADITKESNVIEIDSFSSHEEELRVHQSERNYLISMDCSYDRSLTVLRFGLSPISTKATNAPRLMKSSLRSPTVSS
ncbi:hypothetical protein C0991_005520 [Blastosporella zonata]|nr:hypothetical protein C0991_005520 [Blastosporella zonata]